MAPGLALDSGEFIPASELNRRIDMKPKKITQMKQAGEIRWYSQHPMEVLQKRIAVLEAQLASGHEPRCPYCDGTGDVHGIDGEWRGVCTCSAGKP